MKMFDGMAQRTIIMLPLRAGKGNCAADGSENAARTSQRDIPTLEIVVIQF